MQLLEKSIQKTEDVFVRPLLFLSFSRPFEGLATHSTLDHLNSLISGALE